MKVWRGITLGFWITLMTGCVSLVAVYYIVAQTILNPATVKKWLNDSGAYSVFAETIVPKLITDQPSDSPSSNLITNDMIERAAKASIKPGDVKAKTEPIIDATYAWLDSKSPEITFEVSTGAETERFLQALRIEVYTRIKSLPECTTYVDPKDIEQANCLPWYVSPEVATDVVMQRVKGQEALRNMTLTPDSFKNQEASPLSNNLPDIISALWVAQLVALPVFGVIALFVIAKRRAAGLIAVGTSLLTPGLTLLVVGLLLSAGGAASIEAFVEKSEIASIAQPLGEVIARSFANSALQVGTILTCAAAVVGILGIFWRKRARAKRRNL